MDVVLENIIRHLAKISYEMAHEENISDETQEMFMDLWRNVDSYANYLERR